MAEILLQPVDGGDKIKVPIEKTTIGRGPFLQVQDKRVSRNHGTLEIIDEKLVLVPVHTNPCFYRVKGEGSQMSLPKDKPQTLNDSDVFGLLPNNLFYKVIYKSASDKEDKKTEEDECSDTEEDDSDVEKETNHKDDTPTKKPEDSPKSNGAEDVALPLDKKRELPKWMVGSSNRVDVSPEKSEKSPTKTTENAKPAKSAKTPAEPKKKGRGRPRGTAMASDDEFAGLSGEEDKPKKGKRKAPETPTRNAGRNAAKKSYTEYSDEDFDVDYEEKIQVKPKAKHSPAAAKGKSKGRGRPRKPRSESEDESMGEEESEEVTPKKSGRRPRAASLKSPGYNDDFVLSDDDYFEREDEDDNIPQGDDDSDFVPVDDDDDEDWSNKQEKTPSKGRVSTQKGKGKGKGGSPGRKRGRPSGRPSLTRTSSKRRTKDSDDEYEDSYKPRPSKRRAAAAQKKYKDRDDSEEDSEFSEEESPPPKKATKKQKESENESEEEEEEVKDKKKQRNPPKKATKKQKESEDENESEEEEEEVNDKKKQRKSCMFGKKCYRKNPKHFKDFCHPGDDSYVEEEEEEEEKPEKKEKKGRGRPKRANAGKKSLLQGASDDDGETNTYDRTDSFMDDGTVEGEDDSSSPFDPNEDDSDFEPEDVSRLKKEAKGFIKNKKMVKPVKRK